MILNHSLSPQTAIMRLSRKGIHPAGVVPFLFQITVVIIAPQARHDERMSCSFRNNRRTEAHYNSVCRRPGIRVPGASHITPQSNTYLKSLSRSEGYRKNVHDVPTGQPTVGSRTMYTHSRCITPQSNTSRAHHGRRGTEKNVHDVPTGQPTVAEPLIK